MKSSTLVVLALLTFPIGMGVIALEGRAASLALREALASQPATASPGFRVAGIMVNSPVHTGADPASDDTFGVDLAFMGTFARTSLAVEYTRGGGGIIGLDDATCAVTSFTDDRGTDLRREESFNGPFEMMTRTSEGGHHVVFSIPSDRLPHAEATRVRVKGVLGLQVATETAEHGAKGVVLQAGEDVTLGDFTLRIESVGPNEWMGEGFSMTVSSSSDLAGIVAWAFVLPDGTEVPLSPSMSMSGMGQWQQTLDYDRELEEATLRITCWKDLRRIEVPFELSSGLGLR